MVTIEVLAFIKNLQAQKLITSLIFVKLLLQVVSSVYRYTWYVQNFKAFKTHLLNQCARCQNFWFFTIYKFFWISVSIMLFVSLCWMELYTVNLLTLLQRAFMVLLKRNLPVQTETYLKQNIFMVPGNSVFTDFIVFSSVNPVKIKPA